MKKTPPEFMIQEYKVRLKRRSWMACQENDNSPSAYQTITEPRWRIKLGKRILQDELRSLDVAMEYLDIHKNRHDLKWLEKQEELSHKRYEKAIAKAQDFHNRTISALRRQAERARKLGF